MKASLGNLHDILFLQLNECKVLDNNVNFPLKELS